VTVDQSERTTARREQAAATRRQLLDAARATFEAFGYRATTVGAITDKANTAHGTFYLYFRNKEDAFCQVVESVIDEMAVDAFVPLEHGPRSAVDAGIARFVDVYERHAGLWRALLEGMLQSPKVLRMWLDLRRDIVLRVAKTFEAQQRAGTVRDFDPTVVANALASMTEWAAFTHLVLGEPQPGAPRDAHALAATLGDLWHRAVHGAVPDDVVSGDVPPSR
jgi:AcrR family transcriptional regulator